MPNEFLDNLDSESKLLRFCKHIVVALISLVLISLLLLLFGCVGEMNPYYRTFYKPTTSLLFDASPSYISADSFIRRAWPIAPRTWRIEKEKYIYYFYDHGWRHYSNRHSYGYIIARRIPWR